MNINTISISITKSYSQNIGILISILIGNHMCSSLSFYSIQNHNLCHILFFLFFDEICYILDWWHDTCPSLVGIRPLEKRKEEKIEGRSTHPSPHFSSA